MSLLSKQSWTLPLWADPTLRCYNLSIVAVTFRGKVWVAGELQSWTLPLSWSSIEMLQPFYCCHNIQGQGMSSWWAYYQNKAEHYHCELIPHWDVTTFLLLLLTFRGKVWVAGEPTMKAKLNITTVSWSSIEMLQPFYCCRNIQGQGMSSWWAYYQNKAEHYHCELIPHWDVTTFLLFAVTFRCKVWVAGELTMKAKLNITTVSWSSIEMLQPFYCCHNIAGARYE